MKILFVISSLKGGGAERVLVLLANEFSKRKYGVVVTTRSPECAYELYSDIQLRSIFKKDENITGIGGKLKFLFRLTRSIKNEKPDIVISFMKGMNKKVIIVSKLLGIPVIASEHTNYQGNVNFFSWIERRWIYKLADAVTILTNYDNEKFYKHFLTNITVMPNPVSFASIESLQARGKTILAAGNLNSWSIKGFDNLLIVFSKVIKKHPDWKLEIAGSGEEGKKYLMNLANGLNIQDRIVFLEFCQNIDEVMQHSSIFVLCSRHEGFPMVLTEAMSQGCACISFDCVSGPGEIIENNIDGILVENQNILQMEKEICRLIEDKKLREYFAKNAVRNIQRLSLQRIGNKWLNLIDSVVISKK